MLRNVDCFVEAGLRFYRLVLHLENPPAGEKVQARNTYPRSPSTSESVLDRLQSPVGAAMRLRPRSLRCRYRYSGYVAARLVECSRLVDCLKP